MDSLRPLGGDQAPTPSPSEPPFAPSPPRPPAAATRSVKRRSLIPGWAIGLVVLAAVIVSVWYFQLLDYVNPNSPRAVAKAFIAAVEEVDLDRMTQLCTAESQQLMAPMKGLMAKFSGPEMKKEMQKAKEAASKRGVKSSRRVTGTKITGDRAEVSVTMTATVGGQTSTMTNTIPLLREGGKWRIDLVALAVKQMGEASKGRGGIFGGSAPRAAP